MAETEGTKKKDDAADVKPGVSTLDGASGGNKKPGGPAGPGDLLRRRLAQRRKGGKDGGGVAGEVPHKGKMEAGFGEKLDGVVAHTGPDAKEATGALGTQAVAVGQEVAFADESPSEEVVAHEIAHTLQQKNGGASDGAGAGAGDGQVHTFGGAHSDPLEREADLAAKAVAGGGKANVTGQAGADQAQNFSLSEIKNACKDGAQIFWELSQLTNFNLFSGTFEGDLDIGKAAYYCQLVHSGGVLGMLEFDAANRGSNIVHLNLNLYQQTFSVSSAALKLNGINTPSFSSRAAQLHNLRVHGGFSSASVDVGSASVNDGLFTSGKDSVYAANVGLTNLHIDGNYAKGAAGTKNIGAGMKFDEVHIHGLRYPGMPPIDMDVKQAGLNFDMLWTSVGKKAAPAAAGGPSVGGLPSGGDVLPKDSRIAIELDGLHVAAQSADGAMAGAGGFDHFHVKLLAADGHELAALTIDGFHAGGSASGGRGSIDKLMVKGDPGLVKTLLDNPQVSAQPKVAEAIKVLKAYNIEPAVGGTLVLTNVGVSAGADGSVLARASLATKIVVPKLGSLSLDVKNFAAIADKTAGVGGFEKLALSLADDKGKELAYLELDGVVAGATTSGSAATGTLKKFVVRGNVADMVKAAESHIKGLPPAVSAGLAAVKALGIKGDISGDLHGDMSGGKASVGGNLDVKFEAGTIGSDIQLHIKNFKGDAKGSAVGASFDKFEASLNTKGKECAYFGIEGETLEANTDDKSGHFKTKKLEVRGDAGNTTNLLTSLGKKAPTLPPAVKHAIDLVKSHSLAASGNVTLKDVDVETDGKGNQTVKAELGARVVVGGVGELDVKVLGFHEEGAAGGAKKAGFDRLEVKLLKKGGAEAAFFAAGAQGSAGADGSFDFKAKKIEARGDAGNLSALADAASKNIKMLPENVRKAMATVTEFGLDGKGGITLENVELSGDKEGGTHAKGDLHANFDLPGAGKVKLDVRGFTGDVTKTSKEVGFDAFEATLSDAKGAQAAHLLVEGSKGGVTDGATADKKDMKFHAANILAEGNTKNLASLFGGIESKVKALPPQVTKAFDAIKQYGEKFGATGVINLTDVDLGSSDGAITAKGDMSAKVDVPEVGTLEARLKGNHAGGDKKEAGFDTFDLKLVDKKGADAASLHVGGVTLGTDGKWAKVGSIEAKGDGTNLHSVLGPKVQALLPPDMAKHLALLDENKLAFSMKGLSVKEDGTGAITANADEMSLRAAINFVDKSGSVYKCPDASLTIKGAKVVTGPDRMPKTIDAKGMSASGHFTSDSKTGAIVGNATLTTGAVKVVMGPDNSPLTVEAKDIHASGDVLSTTKPSGTTNAPPVTPVEEDPKKKAAEIKALEGTAAAAAGLVKSADIHTQTPVHPGLYGSGALAHLNVLAGTSLAVDVQVQNNAISKLQVAFKPALDLPLWFEAQGIHVEKKGSDGVIKTDVNWFVDFIADLTGMPTKLVTGNKTMPLDLTQLVHASMSHFAESLANAKPPSEKQKKKDKAEADKEAAEGAEWLREEHADWEKDVAKHKKDAKKQSAAKAKEIADEDASKEPISPNIGDIASKGMNVMGTTGTADLQISPSKQGTTVAGVTLPAGNDIHLHGASEGGGRVNLTVDNVVAQVGGNQVTATGLETGNVTVSTGTNSNHIAFDSFDLKQLRWDAIPDPAKAK